MNNVNMSAMNQMGGPVGGAIPMMNNVAGAARQPVPAADNSNQRSQLNTYIYEYFLRNGMYDCARALLKSDQPLKVLRDNPRHNGDDGADGDSKDDIDSKRPDDLPAPNLPSECPESCFLYEWWCLFWDMFNAQRGKGDGRAVLSYVSHTQSQSRQRQEQQSQMLRGLRSDVLPQQQYQIMMRNQANGLGAQHQNELQKKAMHNRQGQNGTPQQQAMLQQQKQNQMQRDPSDGNGQQRPLSPGGSAENAPSPSKRARLDGPAFSQGQMPNGRGQAQGMPQQVGDTGPTINAIQVARHHLQLTDGIEPNNLTAQQFQVPGGANAAQARSLAGYQQGLAQQQAGQMPVKTMPNQGGPPNQGSPMMNQGPDGGNNIANYYNPTDMGAGAMRGAPGGQGAGNGNHALQDYQMQLMLLEQQNKKRLMMARQEQDSMTIPRTDGSGPGVPGMGPNGQPFQGASPQGARHSPNPADGLNKRTPHMTAGNMPSPLPDGANRGSPGNMNFNMPGQGMDPNNMNAKFYTQLSNMDPNLVAGMPNGMRQPSSHPGAGFNSLAQQHQLQMQQQRQQAQQQQVNGQNWSGPNGQMASQPGQGAPQQTMSTPRQGQMPPPSAPAAGAAANGRTQPSSPQGAAAPPTPQQGNKANPTKKKNDAKDGKATKRATKGKATAANLTAGTPSADAPTDGPTPTPQTPITPVHPKSFNGGPNGAVPPTNGQNQAPPAAVGVVAPQQPDASAMGNFAITDYGNYDINAGFADPSTGNLDVLQDFDFDSFLHQDNDGVDNFSFDGFPEMDNGNQIGAD